MYCQTIRTVRDISRDDRARIAACCLRAVRMPQGCSTVCTDDIPPRAVWFPARKGREIRNKGECLENCIVRESWLEVNLKIIHNIANRNWDKVQFHVCLCVCFSTYSVPRAICVTLGSIKTGPASIHRIELTSSFNSLKALPHVTISSTMLALTLSSQR